MERTENFCHEDMSERLLDHLIVTNNINILEYGLNRKDIEFVKILMKVTGCSVRSWPMQDKVNDVVVPASEGAIAYRMLNLIYFRSGSW